MLGADGGLTNPQYVRFADSRSYGIIVGGEYPYGYDHYAAVEPDIHLDRLYGELNRNYFYDLQNDYLRPWFRLLNIINHYSHDQTHNHDRAGFRYSLLSGLAMAAQVTIDDIPPEMPESETTFARRWLNWAKANKEYFTHGDRLFDRSVSHSSQWTNDQDALSGFSHIRGDRGFVFVINPGVTKQIAELTLQLSAPTSTKFTVQEVYPGGMTLKGPTGGEYALGETIRVTVPAKQVRILWIAPSTTVEPLKSMAVNSHEAESGRFVAEWALVSRTADAATFRAHFQYPADARNFLLQSTAESLWSREPWAYDKAYLVLQMTDETRASLANYVPDSLATLGEHGENQDSLMTLSINGVPKTLRAFKTVRSQPEHLTRCYFVDLAGETKPAERNEVQITLPIRTGLVFSGAYIDLPDQMPYGELPSEQKH